MAWHKDAVLVEELKEIVSKIPGQFEVYESRTAENQFAIIENIFTKKRFLKKSNYLMKIWIEAKIKNNTFHKNFETLFYQWDNQKLEFRKK
jgi:hypothetical protein